MIARYSPQPVVLARGAPRRVPMRPPEHRGPDFAEKFDDEVLFYDGILDRGTRMARVLGPPPLNLEAGLSRSTWAEQPSLDTQTPTILCLDRHGQVLLPARPSATGVCIDGPLGRYEIPLTPVQTERFAGRRVIFTLSKNNELRWIKDWMRFYRDVHGADAVLFYDNGSTRYTVDELAAAIGEVAGFSAGCVVTWPFKYGPQGITENDFWDSDYCQRGVFEHARWMFLTDARSVLNCDIDELVVGPPKASLFETTERSLTGHLCFAGVWMYGITGAPEMRDERLHSYAPYLYYLNPERGDEVWHRRGYGAWKWAVVPRRCPSHFQWNTHNIIGARKLYSKLSFRRRFLYRHFREISDNWFYDRSKRVEFQDGLFIRDTALTAALARVAWER